jgi:hypothetical protein
LVYNEVAVIKMNRVKFHITEFPKFIEWAGGNDTIYWIKDFELAGFHSADSHQWGNISLNEDEYTWFAMRWS